MLPSTNRLNLPLSTKERGKKIPGKSFTLFFKRQQGVFRASVIVSKKVAKGAVARNRIKRLVLESLRGWMTKIQGKLLVVVKENLSQLKKQEVDSLLSEQLKRLKWKES